MIITAIACFIFGGIVVHKLDSHLEGPPQLEGRVKAELEAADYRFQVMHLKHDKNALERKIEELYLEVDYLRAEE